MLLFDFINRQFLTEPPVPTTSYKGRTVIVTGSNTGLGLEAVRGIVRLGAAKVIIACRTIEKGNAAAKSVISTTSCSPETIEVWHLDLSSYASVLAFADKVKTELPRLDAVLANAGMHSMKFKITEKDEETITTNVVSTALVAFLLYPKLRETAQRCGVQTHLSFTASELYEQAGFKERKVPEGQIFATLANKDKSKMMDRYNVSKLLDIFIVKKIAALAPLNSNNVIVNCVAPGFCQSELGREFDYAIARWLTKKLARPTEVGARTLIYGASAGPETHGQYLPDCNITETKGLCRGKEGEELQRRVWVELRDKLEAIRPGVTTIP